MTFTGYRFFHSARARRTPARAPAPAVEAIPRLGPGRLTLLLGMATLAVALLASQALAQGQEREVSRSFPAREGMRVELENLAGAVNIEGVSGGEIEIVATIHAEANGDASAQNLLDSLRVSFDASGDTIEVIAEYPVDRYTVYRYPQPGRGRSRTQTRYQGERVTVTSGTENGAVTLYVDFRMRLPHGVGADVDNSAGNVSATGVQGPLSAATGSGDIDVADGAGSLSADTGSGDVTVRNQQGNVSVDTGSGDVTVSDVRGDLIVDTGSGDVVATNISASSINADTGSGDIRLERVSGSLLADTGSGDIQVSDLRAGARLMADTGSGDVDLSGDLSQVEEIEIDTGAGDVEIRMTAVPAMRLQIESGSGGIDVDLPNMRVIRSGRHSFSGEVGTGAASVRISTGSGSVTVKGS